VPESSRRPIEASFTCKQARRHGGPYSFLVRIVSKFLLAVASPEQFPKASAPEVAFLGRSNVGKSSLLNSLAGEKLARVSNTPGRTQTINFFALNFGKPRAEPDLVFADLPGYGYAKAPVSIVSQWPKFIEPYLEQRSALRLCVCLVDSNIPPQKSDRQLIEWLRSRQRSFQVVATKGDRISGSDLVKSLKALRREFEAEPLPYSAKTGRGRDELWQIIRNATGASVAR
jgi:GTP-binding protein